jgi:hypothetical protein
VIDYILFFADPDTVITERGAELPDNGTCGTTLCHFLPAKVICLVGDKIAALRHGEILVLQPDLEHW